jgi:hypothetical protein
MMMKKNSDEQTTKAPPAKDINASEEESFAAQQLSYMAPYAAHSTGLSSHFRIDTPSSVDILLGRGKPFQSHLGNQRMLRIVDACRERYLKSERKEKHTIVEDVIAAIMEIGGRFLSRVDYENYWVEVNHSIAYRKVGHAFRSKARRSSDGQLTSFTPSAALPGVNGFPPVTKSLMSGMMPPAPRSLPAGLPFRSQARELPMLTNASGSLLGNNGMPAVRSVMFPSSATASPYQQVGHGAPTVFVRSSDMPFLQDARTGAPMQVAGVIVGQDQLLYGQPHFTDGFSMASRQHPMQSNFMVDNFGMHSQVLPGSSIIPQRRYVSEASLLQDKLMLRGQLPSRRFF